MGFRRPVVAAFVVSCCLIGGCKDESGIRANWDQLELSESERDELHFVLKRLPSTAYTYVTEELAKGLGDWVLVECYDYHSGEYRFLLLSTSEAGRFRVLTNLDEPTWGQPTDEGGFSSEFRISKHDFYFQKPEDDEVKQLCSFPKLDVGVVSEAEDGAAWLLSDYRGSRAFLYPGRTPYLGAVAA